ncbi:MAG: aspartyl-tRNA(Asn)/glutamyl-tRNA(Gln) amidotransferase subunit [Candidatus Atribacteria bacterium]|nr:aspartyl-tRNA(Asn)/glutamyl-tRNA(Gln) amidotransferase subunit [Candidatus Atribacteria bacterium]
MKVELFKDFTIADYHKWLREEKISLPELIEAFLERIKSIDPDLHAFLEINQQAALTEADILVKGDSFDKELAPLWGIPIAIKDNICVQGLPTTCGSRILRNYRSPYNATVIERLKEAGAIIIGKTNMDEFAMGSSTENSAFGPTRNPFDLERVAGGSSGGSAASVAALEVPISLGSDTGGSIRQPASFCGVVGLRPTYGRVSRYGLVSFASSLDQIGPIARSVDDCTRVFEIISGKDEQDSTCAPYPPFSRNDIPTEEEIRKLKIGLPREYFSGEVEKGVLELIEQSIDLLRKNNLETIEVRLPHTDYALEAYYIVSPCEASSNLARYDGVLYGFREKEGEDLESMYLSSRTRGFGEEVKRRIILGTYCLSSGYYDEYYLKGMKVRTLVRHDFEQVFEECDLLLTPVSPCLPFNLGEKTKDFYQMYLTDIFTIPSAMAGLPALSMNCGYCDHLPVGLQIIGPPFREELILGLAGFLEKRLSLTPPFPNFHQ